jgi:hypothetical protein
VAGSVAGARKWLDPVRALRNTMGGICDPNTAWMLLRSLETVELRMQRATENAVKVCNFLNGHPKVEGVGFWACWRRHPAAGHLSPPLHRAGQHLLALHQGRRGRKLPLPRQPEDRQARRQPRRDGDTGEPSRPG